MCISRCIILALTHLHFNEALEQDYEWLGASLPSLLRPAPNGSSGVHACLTHLWSVVPRQIFSSNYEKQLIRCD